MQTVQSMPGIEAVPTQERILTREQILRFVGSDHTFAGDYKQFLEQDPDGIVTRKLIEGDIVEKLRAQKATIDRHLTANGPPFSSSWIVAVAHSTAHNEPADPAHQVDERFPIARSDAWRDRLGKHKIQVCVKLWWKDSGPNYVVAVSVQPLTLAPVPGNAQLWEQSVSGYREQYVFDVTSSQLLPQRAAAAPQTSTAQQ